MQECKVKRDQIETKEKPGMKNETHNQSPYHPPLQVSIVDIKNVKCIFSFPPFCILMHL